MRLTKGMRAFTTVLVFFASCGASEARAQRATRADSGPATAQLSPGTLYPDLQTRREILVSGIGAGLLVTGGLLPVHERAVPPQGLDPADIRWGIDRRIVGHRSLDARRASNWTRDAALAFPLVLAFTSGAPGQRWRSFGTRGIVYAETLLLSQGETLLAKTAWGRPRPYAYLAEDERPDDPAYDVSQGRTFRSMPSGHSSSAWTAATIATTENLLGRPGASWAERALVGFVGGGLAGATSQLRVTAGQHFPTDVVAGAGVGIVTGIAVPLLHRDGRPVPSAKAWLEAMGGTLTGALLGVAIAK